MHTRTHTHTQTHTHTRTHTHAHTHRDTHRHTHTHTHPRERAPARTRVRRARTRERTRRCTPGDHTRTHIQEACTHTHRALVIISLQEHRCIKAYMDNRMFLCLYPHMHIYIRKHASIYPSMHACMHAFSTVRLAHAEFLRPTP